MAGSVVVAESRRFPDCGMSARRDGPPTVGGGAPGHLLFAAGSSISQSMLLTVSVTSHAVARVWAEGSMGKLIYAANISLDGFLEDETGSFDWSVPDEDVHAFWNEHERHIGTSLYGRRMYEAMRVWESDDWLTNEPAVVREYAEIWRDADKVVYSTSLDRRCRRRARGSSGSSSPRRYDGSRRPPART